MPPVTLSAVQCSALQCSAVQCQLEVKETGMFNRIKGLSLAEAVAPRPVNVGKWQATYRATVTDRNFRPRLLAPSHP
jgi:hypothetical protein